MRGCKRLKNINSVTGKLGERPFGPNARLMIVHNRTFGREAVDSGCADLQLTV